MYVCIAALAQEAEAAGAQAALRVGPDPEDLGGGRRSYIIVSIMFYHKLCFLHVTYQLYIIVTTILIIIIIISIIIEGSM